MCDNSNLFLFFIFFVLWGCLVTIGKFIIITSHFMENVITISTGILHNL